MDELIELVMEEALAGVSPRPGALALLERLTARRHAAGGRLELRAAFLERTLASADLLDGGPFQTIVCSPGRLLAEARPGHLSGGLPPSGRRSGPLGRA